MFSNLGKTWGAVLGAIVLAVYAALTDGQISTVEWLLVTQAGVTAVGVYLVPLDRKYRWGKTAVACVMAVSEAAILVIPGGIDGAEWVGLILILGKALGIAGLPARSDNGVSAKESV